MLVPGAFGRGKETSIGLDEVCAAILSFSPGDVKYEVWG